MFIIKLIILVIISNITLIVGQCFINPIGPTVISQTVQCLLSIMKYNFESYGILTISNVQNTTSLIAGIQRYVLEEINKAMMWSVRVTNDIDENSNRFEGEDDSHYDDRIVNLEKFTLIDDSDYYVIITDSLSKFKQIIRKESTLRSWNPRAKFIVTFYKKDLNQNNRTAIILTFLFRMNVLNVVVVTPNANNARILEMFTYRPFDPPRYCGYRNESAEGRLVLENTCLSGKIQQNKTMFMEHIPLDFYKCELHAIVLKRPPFFNHDINRRGIERRLFDRIASILNLTIVYDAQDIPRGEKNEDGEWEDALSSLIVGNVSILAGGIFPDNDVHEDFEGSETYLRDSFTWVVPRATIEPRFEALIHIFNKNLWILMFIMYVLSVIFWFGLAQLVPENKYNKMLSHCIMNAWYTTLLGSAYMRPRTQSLRIFFVVFTLYCLVLLTVYQTKLIAVLTNPFYQGQIKDINELINSTLGWGGFEELDDLFDDDDDQLDQIILRNYTVVSNIRDSLKDVVIHRNFSLLYNRLSLIDLDSRESFLSDHSGNPRYYAFKENVLSIPLEFVALKGFPMMNKINDVIRIMKQSGSVQFIVDEYIERLLWAKTKLHSVIDDDHTDDEHEPLTIEHLEGGFMVLGFGYLFGSICFVCELLVSTKWVQKKSKRITAFMKSKYENCCKYLSRRLFK